MTAMMIAPAASSHPEAPVRPVKTRPCPRTLGPLPCAAGEEGHLYGCVFMSTSGVPDRHTASSGE